MPNVTKRSVSQSAKTGRNPRSSARGKPIARGAQAGGHAPRSTGRPKPVAQGAKSKPMAARCARTETRTQGEIAPREGLRSTGAPAGLKARKVFERPATDPASRKILATDNLDDVWQKYRETKDPEIRNFLIERHMPLVKKISERLLMTLPKSIELNDLVSWGVFGLMDAIEGFDLSRGIKFKTYCSTRIRGAILDELRSQDWVPRLVRLKAHQINKAYKALEEQYGREPTDFEMAQKLEISIEEYSNLVKESSPKAIYSLNEKWDEQQNDEPMEKIELVEDKNSSDPVEYLNQKDILMSITRSLSRKEKLIIIMYYYEGLTMKEIGNILNLTESRVCQIHSNIVSKLKVQLDKVRKKLLL